MIAAILYRGEPVGQTNTRADATYQRIALRPGLSMMQLKRRRQSVTPEGSRPFVANVGALLTTLATLICTGCASDSAGIQALPGVEVTVTPAELVLGLGEKASLNATVHDLEGHPLPGRMVTWSSSAPDVVAVSGAGVVTALDVGAASIEAYSGQAVGFSRVVVALDFHLPLASGSSWLVITEAGTPGAECPGNEGGLRLDGTRDCTHSGTSRYSLDFADADQWMGIEAGSPSPQVLAAADGTIIDVCLQPPTEVTCGLNGPFVLVEHRGGFRSIYAHLNPASVVLRRKTAVTRGQALGSMGRWGNDPAPWLHFELRYESQGLSAALRSLKVDGRKVTEYRVGETLRR